MMRQETPTAQLPIQERVKRWDVYDIADELADVPGMFRELAVMSLADAEIIEEVSDKIRGLERRLWAAAERSGKVGPYPMYHTVVR